MSARLTVVAVVTFVGGSTILLLAAGLTLLTTGIAVVT